MSATTAKAHVRVLAGFLVLALLSSPGQPLRAETLKLATIAPEGSSWMSDMRAGARQISQRTEGRVEVKFYGGGVQGNARQVQRKMRTGQLHGGAFTSGELDAFQTDASLYGLPLMFNDVEEVRHVRRHLDDELRGRMEDAGFATFGFAGGGFAYLMSNHPISRLAEFNGRKVWTPEGDEVSFASLQSLGIAPVMMPITDVLTGLQTDLLDSVVVPPVGAVVFQWHTRLKYVTELPVAYIYGALVIDKRHFSRLSEQDQAVVREVFEGVYDRLDQRGIKDNREALAALLDSGLEMVDPDAGQVPAWREKVLASHTAQAARGQFDEALFERLRGLLEQYRSGNPETGPGAN